MLKILGIALIIMAVLVEVFSPCSHQDIVNECLKDKSKSESECFVFAHNKVHGDEMH